MPAATAWTLPGPRWVRLTAAQACMRPRCTCRLATFSQLLTRGLTMSQGVVGSAPSQEAYQPAAHFRPIIDEVHAELCERWEAGDLGHQHDDVRLGTRALPLLPCSPSAPCC